MRAATGAGTPCVSRNRRTARSAPVSSQEATASPILRFPMPGNLLQPALRVGVDAGEDLVAVLVVEPLRALGAHVLDGRQVRADRLVADRLADHHPAGQELTAVLGVLAPVPADVHRLAFADVCERAGDGDLVAGVGHARPSRRSRRRRRASARPRSPRPGPWTGDRLATAPSEGTLSTERIAPDRGDEMGFLDKAKQMAEQAQQKLDEVQKDHAAKQTEDPRPGPSSNTTAPVGRSPPGRRRPRRSSPRPPGRHPRRQFGPRRPTSPRAHRRRARQTPPRV